jgi:dihydrofolate reductase
VRKVVLYTLMSLDGAVDDPARFFAPGGGPGQPPEFDPVMEDHEAAVVGAQDAVLLGRHMYDEWSRYWPTVADQPFAGFINGVKKYVVTSTPLGNGWHNAEAVAGPVDDLVHDLRARPGRDIGVHGSIELARSLLEADLVDELHLVVGPAYGFAGRRLFASGGGLRRLELVSATATPSGSVLLSYARPGPAARGDVRAAQSL